MIIGTNVPQNVQGLASRLKKEGLWHVITNNVHNQEAFRCEDAAEKRIRLGTEGIPLCDELKSNLGFFLVDGSRRYVLLHCRGNQKLDEEKLTSLLGSEFHRLPKEELTLVFQCEYGLVNPFAFAKDFAEVEQIFDSSVIEEFFPPYTLMTNAGHRRWAIEFRAKELYGALPIKRRADIIADDSKFKIRKHKIGILTGNGPESGIFLWQKINETIRTKLGDDFLGDLSFPTVLVKSMPEMGLSMELDNRLNETWKIVEEGITSLCKDGATIVGIACNTTQFFSEQIKVICNKFDAEFFSMFDAVNSYLAANHIAHFDFLGIKFVTDFNKWSDFRKLNDLYSIEIPSAEDLDNISHLAFEVKRKVVTSAGINKLRNLINQKTKTKNIIIALTEISILLATQKQNQKSDKHFIDTLSLLGGKIADRYLEDYSEMLLLNQKALKKFMEPAS